jgi:16S rRNA (adenine1518-N6/adenine1519-N6)-dimethyltransferase
VPPLTPPGTERPPRGPKKSLGQHFLRDRTVPPRIAEAAGLQPDSTVVEVGPGLGVLTEELAARLDPQRGRLIAVELDQNLIPGLETRFAGMPHVSFVHADVLEVQPEVLVGDAPYKVVANLPYYITSAIMRHFLDAARRPESLTVMVQREVADRMTARPPEMSLLAVAVQFYGRPRTLFRVPPGAFNPPPKVDSAVVHIEIYKPEERPARPRSVEAFFRVAQAGFGQRRKQLVNTLATGLSVPKDVTLARLREAGVDPTRRAETLTLPEWGAVADGFGDVMRET